MGIGHCPMGSEEQEGNWKGKWTDGSAWNFTKWSTKRYRQPDNDRDEDCLQIQFSENAQKNCNTFRFVCSKKMFPAPKSVSANYTSTGTEKFCSDFPVLLVLLPSGVILIITVARVAGLFITIGTMSNT